MILLRALLKLLFNVIPLFLMSIGRSNEYAKSVYDNMSLTNDTMELNTFMLFSFILGVIFVYIYYPFRYEMLKFRVKKHNSMLKEVTKELRHIFCKTLGKEIKLHKLNLNVRKFKKRPFYKKHFFDWFNKNKIYYSVYNYDFLNNEGHNEKFDFQVSPIQRGLVGVAYGKKKIMYDDRLMERMDEFNLNNIHKSNPVIANTDFAIVRPFVGKKNKIKSMIAFDTEQDVTISDDLNRAKIEGIMLYYSNIFGKLLTGLK